MIYATLISRHLRTGTITPHPAITWQGEDWVHIHAQAQEAVEGIDDAEQDWFIWPGRRVG